MNQPDIDNALRTLRAAGPLRLNLTMLLKLEDYELDGAVGSTMPTAPGPLTHPAGGNPQTEDEPGEIIGFPDSSDEGTYGEKLYEINPNAQPPRVGSMNSSVLALLKEAPPIFTRAQFEALIPRAMNYNEANQKFGMLTKFTSIKRAQQAYFSEFRKRLWIIPVLRGVTLAARLLDDGRIIVCLFGASLPQASLSKPQHPDMLKMQLDKSPLTADEKQAFLKRLTETRTAEIFLPRGSSTLVA